MDSDEVFILAALGTICFSVVVVSVGRLVAKYLELRAQRSSAVLSQGVEERLRLIQSTVEATAIEVERVAESNRYLTRLLGETRAKPAIAASGDDKPS